MMNKSHIILIRGLVKFVPALANNMTSASTCLQHFFKYIQLLFPSPVALWSFPCDVCCFPIGCADLIRVVVRPLMYLTRFCIQDRHDQPANRLKNNNMKRRKEMIRLLHTMVYAVTLENNWRRRVSIPVPLAC